MVQLDKGTAHAAAPPGTEPYSRPAPDQVERFFRDHYRLLMHVAKMHGATKEEADDAVGATMIDLLQRWDMINNPRAYACRAVLSNFIKRRERDIKETERLLQTQAPLTEIEWDSRMTMWEDREYAEQLLDRLPRTQREIMAHYLDGLTSPEIAEYLDKKPAAIRKNLQFARERLRTIIEQERCIQAPITPTVPRTREEAL
ncbi:sigma-70 family RNA polymerase sigma factor [Nonomuraea sp. NPDC046802]|uniref:RNA polymerase sigma factor n=1 Tax=Nonomuraea sp. NPDC046802 TaxID=3154919 RepID=UPI0033E3928C